MAKTLKDFLNERQLGPMVVKNPDEQKFIDKHVVAKTADRNGNDDELFKGSKVKMADRPKHRKGYNPGEDEEVYEALKGAQHKIDANKNGKVDAHDFHLLRKKKKVAEAADDAKLAFQLHMAKKREELRKKGQLAKEEAEALDELSTEKLLAYRKKAREADTNKHHVYADEADEKIKKKTGVYNPNLLQRAKAKLRNEEAEELEELSTDTMKSYGDKRARTVFSGGRKPGESVDAAINRKSKQSNSLSLARTKINRARDTGSTVLNKEEIEQIDELSHDTLRRYRMKAKSIGDNEKGDINYRAKGRELAGRKTYGGRMAGIEKAKVMAKEEAEELDELSIGTMKSYGDKRARTAFSGGRKPGQSVDAGIKMKSKQSNSLSLARTKINRARDTGSTVLNKEEADLEEKLNMDKASMGTVIKDFQTSDAPQFQGKSQKKRQVMAIAAKLSAERGKLPMNKEQRLLVKLDDLAEVHKRTMVSVFEKLNEDNQYAFMQACDTADGIEQMLDFSISYRGE